MENNEFKGSLRNLLSNYCEDPMKRKSTMDVLEDLYVADLVESLFGPGCSAPRKDAIEEIDESVRRLSKKALKLYDGTVKGSKRKK